MPIPSLCADGLLPQGIHTCTLHEISETFGRFQRSDQRINLTNNLQRYLHDLSDANRISSLSISTKMIDHVIVDGSYITAKDEPGDIDLVIALSASLDLNTVTLSSLSPAISNPISAQWVKRRYGFDTKVAQVNSTPYQLAVTFFEGVKGSPHLQKGLLKVSL